MIHKTEKRLKEFTLSRSMSMHENTDQHWGHSSLKPSYITYMTACIFPLTLKFLIRNFPFIIDTIKYILLSRICQEQIKNFSIIKN